MPERDSDRNYRRLRSQLAHPSAHQRRAPACGRAHWHGDFHRVGPDQGAREPWNLVDRAFQLNLVLSGQFLPQHGGCTWRNPARARARISVHRNLRGFQHALLEHAPPTFSASRMRRIRSNRKGSADQCAFLLVGREKRNGVDRSPQPRSSRI